MFRTLNIIANLDILGVFRSYSDIFNNVVTYLKPCVTLLHIHSTAIFRILAYLEPEILSELCQHIHFFYKQQGQASAIKIAYIFKVLGAQSCLVVA